MQRTSVTLTNKTREGICISDATAVSLDEGIQRLKKQYDKYTEGTIEIQRETILLFKSGFFHKINMVPQSNSSVVWIIPVIVGGINKSRRLK